jgi:hypothetical protein
VNHENLPKGLRDAEPQYDVRTESLGLNQDEEGSPVRTILRITRLGVRLLDADNLCGGCKYIVDACRYEGLVANDDPQAIILIVRQRKVKRAETGTILEIY